jgi:CDP-diglyceride synthetase
MPRSRKIKNHHDYQPPANAVKSKKNRSAVTIGIVFFALIGMGIGYFAAGASSLWPLWLVAGAVLGAIGGYYFGRQIDRSFSKK